MRPHTSSMSNGTSGTSTTSAPPAMPEWMAIQPAWRPITSTTITRSWLSAVVCSRSMASVAICTAVWKPNVKSVAARSLSIVFGHAHHGDARLVGQPGRHAEGVLAADRHQRVDALAAQRLEHAGGTVVGLERVGARRAEDGAAAVDEPPRGADGELDGLAVEHAPPAVAEPDDLVAVHAFALAHDGPDHRVEARAVAAAGEHPDAHGHQCDASPARSAVAAVKFARCDRAVRGTRPSRRGTSRLFRGRHYRQVAVVDGRVTVTSRRGDVVLDVAADELELTRVRNGLLLQVLATDTSSRTHVFEFRPRRHFAGRSLADALR